MFFFALWMIQENCNAPQYRTPRSAIPRATPIMNPESRRFLPVGKVKVAKGVCSKGVLKQPENDIIGMI